MDFDNAAGHLHHVLSVLKTQPSEVLGTAWSELLGIDLDDRAALFRAIAAVAELPDLAVKQIEATPGVTLELYTRWRAPVHAAMQRAHLLEQQAQQMVAHYSETHLAYLEVCAERIAQHGTALRVNDDALAEARGLADEVLELLREATELPAEVRELLVRHATALRTALDLADVLGGQAIQDAVAGVIGAVALAERASTSARQSKSVQRLWEVLDRFTRLTNLVTGTAGAVDELAPAVEHVIRQITSG
ncbi:hypothetical protein [Cellulomonas carbonis]|uniref:Uncharacterized protein n=1 Tax=Cellulomonas carbonis T26 TaxID=947969 RepID=A0A0A0BW33_9CELL|nr:hypothetical protein [Cellulomonas carbonis]KGM11892.1 hypothetical protein N868_04970 [Cellulomonas carbonis T26]GGB91438.1 hypothetical protein GCM10010972_00080 [Cellulomonas carbonis]